MRRRRRGILGAALRDQSAKSRPGAPEIPALGKRVGHHEADVVTAAGVLATGVAEPDDQPVGGSDRAAAAATKRPAQRWLLSAGAAVASGALGRLALVGGRRLGLALADELGLGLDLVFCFRLGLQARWG